MAANNPPQLILIECRHEQKYVPPFPKNGDVVYCRLCQDYLRVVGMVGQISIRCGTCVLSRTYGRDMDTALRVASKHVLVRQGHVVTVWDDGQMVQVIGQEPGQGELPFTSTYERRVALAKEQQHSLRNFIESLPSRALTEEVL